jgi:hypothetical protein
MTLDDGAQPRCEACGVGMRDVPGGWQCPACDLVLAPNAHPITATIHRSRDWRGLAAAKLYDAGAVTQTRGVGGD